MRKQVLISVLVEREFLHPEVADLSKTAKLTVAKLEVSLVNLLERLRGVDAAKKLEAAALEALYKEFSNHIDLQHDKLFLLSGKT